MLLDAASMMMQTRAASQDHTAFQIYSKLSCLSSGYVNFRETSSSYQSVVASPLIYINLLPFLKE